MWEKFKRWALKLNLRRALLITGLIMAVWGTVLNVAYTIVRYKIQKAFYEEEGENRGNRQPSSPWGTGNRGREEGQQIGNIDNIFIGFSPEVGSSGWRGGPLPGQGIWQRVQAPPALTLHAFFFRSPFMVVLGVITLLLGLWYWLLIMIWAFQKSTRLGIRSGPWVFLTFFLNLLPVIVLYLYGAAAGTCKTCGHVRIREGSFCPGCGAAFRQKCPSCGGYAGLKDHFCPWCGESLTLEDREGEAKRKGEEAWAEKHTECAEEQPGEVDEACTDGHSGERPDGPEALKRTEKRSWESSEDVRPGEIAEREKAEKAAEEAMPSQEREDAEQKS